MTEIFDRKLLRQRRDRAASAARDFEFLFVEVADRLVERLDVIKKTFPLMLDLGGAHGALARQLQKRDGTEKVVSMDISFEMAKRAGGMAVVADEEFLPFRSGSLDAVVSNLGLQWVNDLPGTLVQIRNALKADGLFLGALLGGESLKELRQCLMEAELAVSGGASPRVSPFADPHDVGALMQRAGYALPVVDSDVITVQYSDVMKLMKDLRGMGASNATTNRPTKPMNPKIIQETERLYREKFADAEGKLPATFQVIYMIGWAPHEGQQQPLKPGSAKKRLSDALNVIEFPGNDKARP